MANTNEGPTYKYSQEEIDQAWDFHQAIIASGNVPLDTVARDVGVSAVSGVLTYFLFWPASGFAAAGAAMLAGGIVLLFLPLKTSK